MLGCVELSCNNGASEHSQSVALCLVQHTRHLSWRLRSLTHPAVLVACWCHLLRAYTKSPHTHTQDACKVVAYWIMRKYDLLQINSAALVNVRGAQTFNENPLARQSAGAVEVREQQ